MPIYYQLFSPHVQAASGTAGASPFRESTATHNDPPGDLWWYDEIESPFSEEDKTFGHSQRLDTFNWTALNTPIRTLQPGWKEWIDRHGSKCVAVGGVVHLKEGNSYNRSLIFDSTLATIIVALPRDVEDFETTEPQYKHSFQLSLKVRRTTLSNEQFLTLEAFSADGVSTFANTNTGALAHWSYHGIVDAVRACPYNKWFYFCLFMGMMPDGRLRYRVDINNLTVMDGILDAETWSLHPEYYKDYTVALVIMSSDNAGSEANDQVEMTHWYLAADSGEPNEGDTILPASTTTKFSPGATGRSYNPQDYMLPAHRVIVCPVNDPDLSDPDSDPILLQQGESLGFSFDTSSLGSGTAMRVVCPKLYCRGQQSTWPTPPPPLDYIETTVTCGEETLTLRGHPSKSLESGYYGPLAYVGALSWDGVLGSDSSISVTDVSPFALKGEFSKSDLQDLSLSITYTNMVGYDKFATLFKYGVLLVTEPVSDSVLDDIFSNCDVTTYTPVTPRAPEETEVDGGGAPTTADKLRRFDVVRVMNKNAPKLAEILRRCVDNTPGEKVLSTIIDANYHAIANIAEPTTSSDVITE